MPGKLDLLFLIYLLWGFLKGLRRGLGRELQAFIDTSLLLAFLMGIGVFAWLHGSLAHVADAIPILSGFVGAVLALLAALWLFHLMKFRLGGIVERRANPASAGPLGGLIGVLRTTLIATGVTALLAALPLDFIRKPVVEGSVAGRALAGVAAEVRQRLQPPPQPTPAPEPVPAADTNPGDWPTPWD